MTIRSLRAAGAALLLPWLAAAGLCACSPTYNWRDYASPDASYRVTFPAKPSTFTRDIDLDGLKVAMTMTAAEVDGATFAVGTAQAPDPVRAQAALEAMQVALVRNIDGKITRRKSSAASGTETRTETRTTSDIEADGVARGEPMHLVAHFEARGTRFYQAIVIGRTKDMPPEQVEQFLTSFTPQ